MDPHGSIIWLHLCTWCYINTEDYTVWKCACTHACTHVVEQAFPQLWWQRRHSAVDACCPVGEGSKAMAFTSNTGDHCIWSRTGLHRDDDGGREAGTGHYFEITVCVTAWGTESWRCTAEQNRRLSLFSSLSRLKWWHTEGFSHTHGDIEPLEINRIIDWLNAFFSAVYTIQYVCVTSQKQPNKLRALRTAAFCAWQSGEEVYVRLNTTTGKGGNMHVHCVQGHAHTLMHSSWFSNHFSWGVPLWSILPWYAILSLKSVVLKHGHFHILIDVQY